MCYGSRIYTTVKNRHVGIYGLKYDEIPPEHETRRAVLGLGGVGERASKRLPRRVTTLACNLTIMGHLDLEVTDRTLLQVTTDSLKLATPDLPKVRIKVYYIITVTRISYRKFPCI